ncbi:armadillo-type protein [Catenaria anguillulae PL171]|uniref:Armadillo-type protein n=1 Tax=Catenaria anguillulae PL171 TaxID=765915 RepID=A0A1Y2HEA8_9FUNG|nr:armadillo-type protein [Catenaria anguillulae PL171]
MASIVSSFIRSTVSRTFGPGAHLPNVSLGDKVPNPGSYGDLWTSVYNGHLRDDATTQATIFHFDPSAHPRGKDLAPLAQNALKRFKTIRHPDVLRYLDGTATDSGHVYIVTDRVSPCSLAGGVDERLLVLGLYKIATALQFLHRDCKLAHGNLNPKSIYVTPAGEWRLGGLELVTAASDTFTPGAHLLQQPYRDPSPSSHGIALDMFLLGSLIQAAIPSTSPVAPDLHRYMQMMLVPEPTRRPGDLAAFLHCATFGASALVSVCSSMENMAMLDERERNALIERVAVAVDEFPVEFSKFKVLPILLTSLEHGTVAPKTLAPIFKIAAHLSSTEFATLLNPSLVKLFSLTDRAVRLTLLEVLPLFVSRLDKKLVDKLFPHIALGFADTAPIIREHTVRAMVLLAPVMSSSLVNGDVLRHLGKAQTDSEPGIRTNATVCLAKVAPHLSTSMRGKVLIPGLTRALADTFPPARVAGLNGLVVSLEYFSAPDMAAKVLPAVAPLMLDSEKTARNLAFQIADAVLVVVRDAAAKMPETGIPVGSPAEGALDDKSRDASLAMAVAVGQAEVVSRVPGSGAVLAAATATTTTTTTTPGTSSVGASRVGSGSSLANAFAAPMATSSSSAVPHKQPASTGGDDWDGWGDSLGSTLPTTTSSTLTPTPAPATSNTASSSMGLDAWGPLAAKPAATNPAAVNAFASAFGSPSSSSPSPKPAAAAASHAFPAAPQWSLPPPPPGGAKSSASPFGGSGAASASNPWNAFGSSSSPSPALSSTSSSAWPPAAAGGGGAAAFPPMKPMTPVAASGGMGGFPSLVPTPATANAKTEEAKADDGWGDWK